MDRVFLDRIISARHHVATMKFTLFRKKVSPPSLVTEEVAPKKQKIDTLKAGKLASLALSLTDKLITTYGPRIAGTEASRKTALDLETELKEFCDTTEYTEFSMHSEAYTLWLKLMVIVYPVVLLFSWFGLPILALMLYGGFCIYVAREFFFFKPVCEKYTPSTLGANVHGVIEPKEEVRHTIIFSGHHDSARLYQYNKLDREEYAKKVLLPIILFILLGFSSVVQFLVELLSGRLFSFNFPPLANIILNVLLTLGIPLLLPLLHFVSDKGSPGAGDNLVSSCMSVQLSRFFDWKRKCGKPLEHTRLIFCSFDGEEVGLRGSRAWFQKNVSLLEDPIMLNFDSPYYADELTFLERDVNGFQPLSSNLARRCVKIARDMGYKATSEALPLFAGGTDAAEAYRSGVEASTLTGIVWDDRSRPAVYHTPDDLVSSIEPKAIEQALSIAIRLVELFDAEALYDESEPIVKQDQDEGPDLVFSKLSIR